MKAAVVRRYGSPEVVRLVHLPDPTPAVGEVLVRVRATTVSSGDARVRAFRVPGVFWLPARLAIGVLGPRRRVLGTEFAGTVETVGEGVTRFKPGDRVFGMASFSKPVGSHAELLTIEADGLVAPMPEGLSFEDAGCMCFGLLTARHFLQKAAKLQAGERVLIIGGSGAVGCAAVQLARHAGAHVTAVCSAGNAETVRSIGADAVIDYTREDYTQLGPDGARYDIVFDTVGATSPLRCRGALTGSGRYVALVMDGRTILQAAWFRATRSKRVIMGVASETPEDLAYFSELVRAGRYRSVIDRCFTLDEIVAAHRVVDGGHKRGNAVVTISPPPAGAEAGTASGVPSNGVYAR